MNISKYGLAPIVYAGEDVVIRTPDVDLTLMGSALSSSVGAIKKGVWVQIWGPKKLILPNESRKIGGSHSWSQSLVLKDMDVGSYRFRFIAGNKAGFFASDAVSCIRLTLAAMRIV